MPGVGSICRNANNPGICSKYRNIEEMQQQNQKLLGVIRELSEEKEKREGENA